MIVVADTSVVLNLCRIQHEHLLPELFGAIIVPHEVASEFVRLAGTTARFAGLRLPPWIRCETAPPPPIELLREDLDIGETAAIALCLGKSAYALLIDESLGRAVALRFGLKTIGILGLLLEARKRGLLPKVAPVLNRLEAEAGFWVAPELRQRVLALAGE